MATLSSKIAPSGVATLTGTETLTNKTLTSPVVNVTSDATGDLYYRSAGGAFTRLPIGSTDQVLTVASGLPSWAAAAGGSSISDVLFAAWIETSDLTDDSNSYVAQVANQNDWMFVRVDSGTYLADIPLGDSPTSTRYRYRKAYRSFS